MGLDQQKLRRAMRNSGERAIRGYVEAIDPRDADEASVLYEDGAAPSLMAAATVPMTLTSTRAFVRMIAGRGYNRDAVQALEAIASRAHLKPVINMVIEANGLLIDQAAHPLEPRNQPANSAVASARTSR